jgi:hypothetical protein
VERLHGRLAGIRRAERHALRHDFLLCFLLLPCKFSALDPAILPTLPSFSCLFKNLFFSAPILQEFAGSSHCGRCADARVTGVYPRGRNCENEPSWGVQGKLQDEPDGQNESGADAAVTRASPILQGRMNFA